MKRMKWLVFGVVATMLAWRIIAVNMSQQLAEAGSPAAAAWGGNSAQVLLAEAAAVASTDIKRARSAAEDAVFYNPASGRGFLMLAELLERDGNLALAQHAAKMAHFLAPRDANVQLALGAFWLRRGLPMQTLTHWSSAAEANTRLHNTLFPAMLQIADVAQNRVAAAGLLGSASKWWGQFFIYALNNTTQEDTLKAMYLARGDKVEHEQRRRYIDHLLNNGYYTDAYFVWLNGLQPSEVAVLGNINDGSFEQALVDEGFGWRPSVSKGFMLATEPTYGQSGKKALHIAFLQRLGTGDLIHQFLMLDTGKYRLSGRARLDNLTAGKGVRWHVACAESNNKVLLLSSDHFVGSDDWNRFEIAFDVPAEQCEVQILRLQLNAGNDGEETPFSGSAWFDDMEIMKLD